MLFAYYISHLHLSSKIKSQTEVTKQYKSRFFFLSLLGDGRIRILIHIRIRTNSGGSGIRPRDPKTYGSHGSGSESITLLGDYRVKRRACRTFSPKKMYSYVWFFHVTLTNCSGWIFTLLLVSTKSNEFLRHYETKSLTVTPLVVLSQNMALLTSSGIVTRK